MLCQKERSLLVPICLRNAIVSNPLGHLPGLNSYQVRTLRLSTAIPILSPLQPNGFTKPTRPFGRGCAYAYTRLQSYPNVALFSNHYQALLSWLVNIFISVWCCFLLWRAGSNRRTFCMRMRQHGLLKCHRGIFCELFTFSTSICRPFSGAEWHVLGATFHKHVL